MGAGGSARAVVFALNQMFAEISIFNRTEKKATKLCEDLGVSASLLDEEGMKKQTNSFDFNIVGANIGKLKKSLLFSN